MQWKQAADIFTSFCTRLILYSLPTRSHVAKNGSGSGSFCSWNSFTVVHLNITKKNPLKKNSSSTFDSVTLATEEQLLSWARHTPRARERCSLHTWLIVCCKLFIVDTALQNHFSFKLCVSFRLALFLDPAGWAVSDGSQKNLPKAEAHVQVRYGKDILSDHDIGTMRLHRGWLWMVSIFFF